MSRIAILGGGSWGTGLSVVLGHSRHKHEIRLWVRQPSIAQSIRDHRENPAYLAGVPIPACVQPSTDLREVVQEAQLVLGAVPSAHARSVYLQAVPHLSPDTAIVSATKGLEPATHLRMSEVIEQVFSLKFIPRAVVRTGGGARRANCRRFSVEGSCARRVSSRGICKLQFPAIHK